MHIEYLVTRRPSCNSSDRDAPTLMEQHLIELDGEVRDERATEILCFASAWAYSDLTTFAAAMCPRGLYGEFVGINISNHVAFVDTTAYLFLSDTQQLAILTFRGAELTNSINWLADASASMRVVGEGGIHGGFLTAIIAILPLLQELLLSWSSRSCTLADALYCLRAGGCYPLEAFPTLQQLAQTSLSAREQLKPTLPESNPLAQADVQAAASAVVDELMVPQGPALYICGHSLGGAFASLAGAEFYLRPALLAVKRRLRSIYTFGAPAWGDATIVDALDEKGLGTRVFRHRYANDLVPLLPGRHQGAYKHLGRSYENRDGAWVRSTRLDEQVHLGLLALLAGLLPFLTEAMPGWRPLGIKWLNIPGLMRFLLPYSWPDHKPERYLLISQAPKVGFEILGGDYDARASGLSCWRQSGNQ